jgi:hypothetical protein
MAKVRNWVNRYEYAIVAYDANEVNVQEVFTNDHKVIDHIAEEFQEGSNVTEVSVFHREEGLISRRELDGFTGQWSNGIVVRF